MKLLNCLDNFKGYKNHLYLFELVNKKAGLYGYIAIHNTNRGPAVGGTRIYSYKTNKEAIEDAFSLSEAMTYKCALANVPYGGGKGVIILSEGKQKTKSLLKAYAHEVNKLKGLFYTGEDVGVTEEDVQIMLQESNFFIGKKNQAGDPSPFAALSTFFSIQEALKYKYGEDSLKNKTIAIKGMGKVGKRLAELCKEAGAHIFIADINKNGLGALKEKHGNIQIIEPSLIHTLTVDVYAPCALGNEFTEKNIQQINAKIICGAANNQLSNTAIGNEMFKKGILYVPDYIANAGGLIDVVDELNPKGYNGERVLKNIRKVRKTVSLVLKTSKKLKKPTHIIADEFAHKKVM